MSKRQVLCKPWQEFRGQLNLPPLPLWERSMSWVMDTNSFYYSYMMLYTCMVAKGNLTQLLEMTKNSTYKHIFIICLVSDFFLAHRCRWSNPCKQGRYIHITSACKSLTKSGPMTAFFLFLDSRKEENHPVLSHNVSVIVIKPCNTLLLFFSEFASQQDLLGVLLRFFFQVWSRSLYCNSTFLCGSKASSSLPFINALIQSEIVRKGEADILVR